MKQKPPRSSAERSRDLRMRIAHQLRDIKVELAEMRRDLRDVLAAERQQEQRQPQDK
jgi:hypothetical protein